MMVQHTLLAYYMGSICTLTTSTAAQTLPRAHQCLWTGLFRVMEGASTAEPGPA